MEYILVTASLGELEREVNARLKEGYEVVGGPHPGDGRGIQPRWVQAMTKKPVKERMVVIGERGEPPAKERHVPQVEEAPANGDLRADLNLGLVLHDDPERIHNMPWADVELMIEASRRLFAKRVNKLREIQQTPYGDYITPKDAKEALQFLRENNRVGGLVLEELFAAQRARNQNVVPMVQLSVTDAKMIGELLTLNKGVQYPTEPQQAVDRFKEQLLKFRGTP